MHARCMILLALAMALATAQAVPMEGGKTAVRPEQWAWVAPAQPDHPVRLTVGLQQQRVQALEAVALDVSDPASRDYGQHLGRDAVNALVAPAPAHRQAVDAWLERAGVAPEAVRRTSHGDFVVVETTAAQAGRLLGGVEYHHYRHTQTGRMITRLAHSQSYDLPEDVAEAVAFVAPTVAFPREQAGPLVREPRPDALLNTAGALLELYGVANSTTAPRSTDNWQAVVSFIQQYYKPSDVVQYQKSFANYTHNPIDGQFGENNPSSPGLEASLDTQVLSSVGFNVKTSVWYNGNNETPFLDWLVSVTNLTSVPSVFSISYGDYENAMSADYMLRVGTEFAKLAARGVSVFVAAGDSGVGGNCTGTGRFSPDWPATVPIGVTTVGGAVGGVAGKYPTGELVDGIGGGGFSDTYARPSYQDAAVSAYLGGSTKLPPSKLFNQTGRGYPDLAAQSEMFVVVSGGIPLPGVGGTSCATPTVAGVVSLLNGLRMAAGKPALGFLNPLLYQHGAGASGCSDFTAGQNDGCTLDGGFRAASGWDPASGWGSPYYPRLASLVQKLP